MWSPVLQAVFVVLQGVLLVDQSEKLDSMNLLRYMAPVALTVLIPATLILEPGVFQVVMQRAAAEPRFVAVIAINSALAYFVNLFNFVVTKYTGALTLQVLGNAKGVAATVVSILVFRNSVTLIGMAGYLVTVCGVVLYMLSKRKPA